MLKTKFLILFLLIQIGTYGQNNTVSGTIFNYKTKKPIEGVKITISQSDTIVYSNAVGKFEFTQCPSYDVSLFLSHPGYYSNITTVSWKSMAYRKRIKLFPNTNNSDTLLICDDSEHKIVKGRIVEQNSLFPVSNASIRINENIVFYSDTDGNFSGIAPDSAESITVTHPEFELKTLSTKKATDKYNRIYFELKRVKFSHNDTLWLTYKNLVGIAVNESFNGAIGIRYQRFFKANQAIGLHNSIYFNGKGYNYWVSDTEYRGIKISPYYRIYTNRKMRRGGYLEGKLSVGYFDFDQIWYGTRSDNRRGSNFEEQFWTYGIGLGGGYYWFISRSNNIVFNFYGGFQYLPMKVADKKWSQSYGELTVARGGWYFFGPGSLFELKLIISGVF